MAKPPSDAPVLFDVQSESSTIKQRKDGSYKLVMKDVERVHWETDEAEAEEGWPEYRLEKEEAYALKAPASTGAFYCFNSLTNPINQPSIPGTKYCLNLLFKLIVLPGTSPHR